MLLEVIQAFDLYTHDHCQRVARYAALLAQALSCSPDTVATIYFGGLFHDLGKVGTPESILHKPDVLTSNEYAVVKEHPVKGAHILMEVPEFREIVPIVLHHHEMFGGGGYPEGLIGNDIPLGARIVAVADAYDAITTDRVYRKAADGKKAIDVIKSHTPQQFDPEIVAAFVRVEKNL